MMRPEQVHYDTMEQWIRTSIDSSAPFLFDRTLFQQELERIWMEYDIPIRVSTFISDRFQEKVESILIWLTLLLLLFVSIRSVASLLPEKCPHAAREAHGVSHQGEVTSFA